MHRIRSIIGALAVLALTAGIATAHLMPSASDNGINTARDASGQTVPMAVDGSLADRDAQQDTELPTASGVPSDTHGATVSAAAQGPTPSDGGWANHGAYVSSIAKGWGQQTSGSHASPSPELPSAVPSQAQDGLSHLP